MDASLLNTWKGLWIDASTICFQPFDDWLYGTILSDDSLEDIAAACFDQIRQILSLLAMFLVWVGWLIAGLQHG